MTKKKDNENKPHYIDNKLFFAAMCEWKVLVVEANDLGEPRPPITSYIGECFMKIAEHLSFKTNFANYPYKEEMIGDAILKMFSAIRNKKFDVSTKNNPFSYFTTIAFHAFINRIKKEKKHRETITKYQEAFYGDTLNEDQNSQVYIDPCNPTDDD